MQASTSAASSSTPPTTTSAASTAPAPPQGTADAAATNAAADQKRAFRAAKKAEQERRKEERKKFAQETGVDPALLPKAIAGDLAHDGKVKPKGFVPREWIDVPVRDGTGGESGRDVSIVTWNMLAQALAASCFPEAIVSRVLYLNPDIACLQEVDRLSEHLPSLTLSHGYTSYVGYRQKSHGLLIAHKSSVFDKVGERGIRLDDLPLDENEPLLTPPAEQQTPAGSAPASGTSTPVVADTDASAPSGHADGVSAANGSTEPVEQLTEKEKEIRARPPDAASPSGRAARRAAGLSRTTRNVALFVALAFKDDPTKGVIVGTSHTFWHPSHVYERVRQTALISRELVKFRREAGQGRWANWPLFLAGDLNTQPRELTYRLLNDAAISQDLIDDFDCSRVVHQSVDKLYDPAYEPPSPPEPEAKEGDEVNSGDLSQHPDRTIKNTREATPDDGLGTFEQLRDMIRGALSSPSGASSAREGGGGTRVRSAYGEAYGLIDSEKERWYCSRKPEVQMGNGWRAPEPEAEKEARRQGEMEERIRRGDFEPVYTNFTPLWRCTLDYILLFPPGATTDEGSEASTPQEPRWRKLLAMHDFHKTCEPGLPRKGVEPSDHVAIGAVVELF
ncbi:Endonuclease/exonuclease/phosphatase [Rhodotorula sp. JG-1b]|nr:Endonuclease/exonuclease/phosphatase [Rhodotorula sp. JG-1b]